MEDDEMDDSYYAACIPGNYADHERSKKAVAQVPQLLDKIKDLERENARLKALMRKKGVDPYILG